MSTRWVTFTPDQIKRLPKTPCVYALYSGDELIYVGKTRNIFSRFATCHRYKRTMTHAKARHVREMDLDWIEQRLIRRLRPSKNMTFTGRNRLYRTYRYC